MATNDLLMQDDKKWEKPWSTDEIRKNSSNWTLAGDVGLYCLLVEIGQKIISRTHEVQNAVDSLTHRTKMASVKVNNIINDFHMLSNLQFVENRVYDEGVADPTPVTKPVEKTKEEKEAELLPKIIQAVELGMRVLDTAFTKINVNEVSDSDDEDPASEGRVVFEPKDPFAHRPLPFIIGSEEFNSSDTAGLHSLLLADEPETSAEIESSSSSDTEESSTDEEEPLPLDDDLREPMPRTRQTETSERFSSSEESELFGSEKEENAKISDPIFDRKIEAEKNIQTTKKEVGSVTDEGQDNVANLQARLDLSKVLMGQKLPEKKKEKTESDNLFAAEDLSDDESPFKKRSSLFSSDLKFDGGKEDMFEDDLFGEKVKETKTKEGPITSVPEPRKQSVVEKKPEESALFGNEDEDSDDDIFNKLLKTKIPTRSAETKDSPASSNKSSDRTVSTPSSAPSSKPANAFDFGDEGGDSLFGDQSDDDLFASSKTKRTTSKKFDFNATGDEDDDLFGIANTATKKTKSEAEEEKHSLFEDSVEVQPSPAKKFGQALPGLAGKKSIKAALEADRDSKKSIGKEERGHSLFDGSEEVEESPAKKLGQALPGIAGQKNVESAIEKDKESKQSVKKFGQALPGLTKQDKDPLFKESQEQSIKKNVSDPPKKKSISLFDDDSDDDIFSQTKKMQPKGNVSLETKSHTKSMDPTSQKNKADTTKSKKSSLFEDSFEQSETDDLPSTIKSKKSSLFEDSFEQEQSAVTKKHSSLFEESDNFDLFKAQPSEKESVKQELSKPEISSQSKTAFLENSDDVDSKNSVKISPSPQAASTDDQSVGFDSPADTSQTLHVLNKDRAKISTQRRKPTRKGRISALDATASESSLPPISDESPAPSSVEKELFSGSNGEPTGAPESAPKLTHKAQEKKKMNIMSQLMSEVATSSIGKKKDAAEASKNIDSKSARNEDVKTESKSAVDAGSKTSSLFPDDEDEVDLFSDIGGLSKSKAESFSFKAPVDSNIITNSSDNSFDVKGDAGNFDDAENDEFFSEPSFKNFRASISHKASILEMDDNEDEDDLFSSIKSKPLPSLKNDSTENDIFGDDSDIFADLPKEKYEMFPSQLYDNEDDDIFSNLEAPSTTSSKTTTPSLAKKEIEKKPVISDPLSGLLDDD